MSPLRPIAPQELRAYWPWLRAGLEEISQRYAMDWLPEDIYGVLRSGHAAASIIGEEQGFIILQRQERFTGPCLFVWVIWGELKEYEQAIYAELDTIAREMKAATIECHGRDGWAKRGFFVPGERIYRRKVSQTIRPLLCGDKVTPE